MSDGKKKQDQGASAVAVGFSGDELRKLRERSEGAVEGADAYMNPEFSEHPVRQHASHREELEQIADILKREFGDLIPPEPPLLNLYRVCRCSEETVNDRWQPGNFAWVLAENHEDAIAQFCEYEDTEDLPGKLNSAEVYGELVSYADRILKRDS